MSVRLFTVLCYQKAPEIDAVVHQSKTPKIELLFWHLDVICIVQREILRKWLNDDCGCNCVKDFWLFTSQRRSMVSSTYLLLMQCWEQARSAIYWHSSVRGSTFSIPSSSASLLTCVHYAGSMDCLVLSSSCSLPWRSLVEWPRTGSRREWMVRCGTLVLPVHLSFTPSLQHRFCSQTRTSRRKIMLSVCTSGKIGSIYCFQFYSDPCLAHTMMP